MCCRDWGSIPFSAEEVRMMETLLAFAAAALVALTVIALVITWHDPIRLPVEDHRHGTQPAEAHKSSNADS
jgi:hypothetical protein